MEISRIFNELGEVHCRLSVVSTIRPGIVSLPKDSGAARCVMALPAQLWSPIR
jgi:hypothetical protein